MNRWLLIGSLVGLMVTATGCASCSSSGGCSSGTCQSGSCGGGMMASSCGSACGGGCQSGNCGVRGSMGTAAGLLGCKGGCGGNCGRPGCQAGKLGWQSGGLDYSSHLQTGLLGHNAAANLNSRPFTPGPASGQVAYPYYTTRGPRDFLQANPPSIGR
ncbi:hypothetical protein K239x_45470 [Planctomycetes bacterium K23_9]|uniref:Uncharacterized protein n=2 Tax=Stieleria marina TaxID=1930275 RepID=A0A517NZH3_9BACT|nr:hypothetical protein K239x_45470 [Planctomycetes bacterium K23_9]